MQLLCLQRSATGRRPWQSPASVADKYRRIAQKHPRLEIIPHLFHRLLLNPNRINSVVPCVSLLGDFEFSGLRLPILIKMNKIVNNNKKTHRMLFGFAGCSAQEK